VARGGGRAGAGAHAAIERDGPRHTLRPREAAVLRLGSPRRLPQRGEAKAVLAACGEMEWKECNGWPCMLLDDTTNIHSGHGPISCIDPRG
jgi:hypothetical protein